MIVSFFVVVFLIFGFVVFFGAPYLPTLKNSSKAALDLLALKPGQTLLELGSGDGRFMREAAKRGLKVVGYEINPILYLVSRVATWKYRNQVKIFWGNFWKAEWPDHDGVYVFLIDKYMEKLDKKIKSDSKKGVRLASNSFTIPGKKPASETYGVYLYIY